jgi:3-hydroxybutyryl-CoA dehydrogenase
MANNSINQIIVCGAGTMGSGIAQLAATAGFKVIQFDLSREMLEKSAKSIELSLQKFLAKGKLNEDEFNNIIANITYTTQPDACKGDLIIEAIVEKKEAKIGLFNQLFALNGPDLIVATNTSSIFPVCSSWICMLLIFFACAFYKSFDNASATFSNKCYNFIALVTSR